MIGHEPCASSTPQSDLSDPEATTDGEGLLLRPWDKADAAALVNLYNTEEMDRWRPVAHALEIEQARAYLERAP